MPVLSYLSIRSTFSRMAKIFNNITIKTKYGAMEVTATAIVSIASVYFAWDYTSRAWRKRKINGVLTRSISVGVLHGGKMALERLVDYHHGRADETSLEAAEIELEDLLQGPCPEFKKLQRTVAKLEMSGKEAEAAIILDNAFKDAHNQNKQHEAYELQMLLAEMLIYKGDFVKALRCKCLYEEMISDARCPLYKAIIHVMLEQYNEALLNWEQFKEMRSNFLWPPGQRDCELYEVIEHFDEFVKVVKLLKHDIQEKKQTKQ